MVTRFLRTKYFIVMIVTTPARTALFFLACLFTVSVGRAAATSDIQERLTVLEIECGQMIKGSRADSNALSRWAAAKEGLVNALRAHSEGLAEVTNALINTSTQVVTPVRSIYFGSLLDVLEKSDAPALLHLAAVTLASQETKPGYKSDVLTRLYAAAMVTHRTNPVFRAKTSTLLQTAIPRLDMTTKFLALRHLAGNVEVPLEGVDPEAGLRLLRGIVEDDNLGFRDKESFAYLLATLDPKFVDYYQQNIRVLYLDTLEPKPAGFKLPYAERLHQLGRYSAEDLKTLKEAAAKEGPPGTSVEYHHKFPPDKP